MSLAFSLARCCLLLTALTAAPAAAIVLQTQPTDNLLSVRLAWSGVPAGAYGLVMQRREPGLPFRSVAQLPAQATSWEETPPGRSLVHEYRLLYHDSSRWRRKASNVARALRPGPPPPLPLPVVAAEDANRDGRLDQSDLEAALRACGSGCNLLLLPTRYEDVALDIGAFPAGFALYGFGSRYTILRSPISGPTAWEPTLHVRYNAPDGVVIQDLALDGRKRERQPPLDANGNLDPSINHTAGGITTNAGGIVRRGGVIRRVEIHDYVTSGISLFDAADWTIESNVVRDVGCHQVDTPCGNPRDPSNGWNTLPDVRVPGLKKVGYGILVLANVVDSRVLDNLVERATKHAIVHEGGPCDGPHATRGNLIEGNIATHSAQGIVLNGGCDARIQGNLAYGNGISGAQASPLGAGFHCGAEGDRTQWLGNYATDNAGPGFSLGCFDADDMVVRDNVAWGNCRKLLGAGLFVNGPPSGAQPKRLLIENFTSLASPGCWWGILLRGRDGVTIRGVEIDGGTRYGIELQDVRDVVLESSVFRSLAVAAGDDRGVFFHFGAPDSLTNVFVRPSARFEGYFREAEFGAANSPGDGDSVAYCALEPNPPPGCSN